VLEEGDMTADAAIGDLQLQLEIEDAEPEQIAALSRELAASIKEHVTGCEVLPTPAKPAAPGEKSAGLALIGTILLKIVEGGGLKVLATCLGAYFKRPSKKIRLTVTGKGGKKIQITTSNADPKEVAALLATVVDGQASTAQ
jgi:hypothetical protein